MGFAPVTASSSLMFMVATPGEPNVAPPGLLRLIVKLSAFSAYTSSISGIRIVFDVSPAANVSVPAAPGTTAVRGTDILLAESFSVSTLGAQPSRTIAETPLRRHAVLVLLSFAYLSIWPYFERLNNPNENVRVWMTRAIVEHHTLNIDRVTAEWGYVNDKAQGRGHVYSGKAPGTSLLGVPVLWAQTKVWHLFGRASPGKRSATMALRMGGVTLPMLAFLYVFARWVERRAKSAAARDLLTLGLGAGTMLYPYGILFVGHALAAAAAFTSYILLAAANDAEWPRAGRSRIAAAGALAGLSVLYEYQLLLVAMLLGGYALWTLRGRAVWFVLGSLPLVVVLGAYHTALFGRPWEFPYGHLENQAFSRNDHGSGFFGMAAPHLVPLGTAMFSVSYGLFVFSPFLLVGTALALRAVVTGPRRDAILLLAVGVVLSLFLSGMAHWRAGWCVGPRYIAGLVPFLAAGLTLSWRICDDGSVKGEVLRALVAGLIVASVFLNGISAAVYPHYPEQFDNPVFDLTLPLLLDGYVPYGLGYLLRLPRCWSLLPAALPWAAAAGLAIGGHATTWRRAVARVSAAGVVAMVFIAALASSGRRPSVDERAATTTVRSLWEPAPRR